MADIGGNEGVNRLARALQGRMRELDDTPPVLDFGTIQADMSLMTNTFPKAIPQNDYIACKSLTWRDGNNDMRIKAGDRVLVVWIGDDACVIDIIIPASAIG